MHVLNNGSFCYIENFISTKPYWNSIEHFKDEAQECDATIAATIALTLNCQSNHIAR